MVTISVEQYAQQLRQKYPQYSSVPDDKLVAAFVTKNPQFTANYDDTTLVSVSYEPATAAALPQKPGVTDLVQAPTASEAGTGASQMAASTVDNSGSGPATQQVSGVVVKAASVSTSGAGVAAQAAPVPAPPVSAAPYLGNTVVVNVPAVAGPPMVGKYEIVDELGRGGMGIVYKAFDPGIGRTVALKLMSEQLARDTEFRERFLREARGAGILQHPNIVTVHELGEWQGAPFIAMEFLQGSSLEDILKNEKTMPLGKRLDIVAQVCRGLDYAHARGIVHRDIKPANVMVTTDGVAKVVDFGIARLADQKLTNTGHVLGTVSYMSPEQLQGKTLDGRSDIFAVGVMLFEALTSVLPFAANDTGAAITNTLFRQPPSLSNFLANYPKELDDVMGKCLAKDPAERFQAAGELADRLTQVQQEIRNAQSAPTVIQTSPLPSNSTAELCRMLDAMREKQVATIEEERGRTESGPLPPPHPVISPLQFIHEPKRASRNFPGWVWGVLGAFIVVAVFSAGRLIVLGPQLPLISTTTSQPQPTPTPTPAPLPRTVVQPKPVFPAPEKVADVKPPSPQPVPKPVPEPTPASQPWPDPKPGPAPVPEPKPSILVSNQDTDTIESRAEAFYKQKNYAQAAPLFDQACTEGRSKSCGYLAHMNAHAEGFRQGESLTEARYSWACDGGDANACNNLGVMYDSGKEGVAQDYSQAAALFSRACDSGSAAGCADLGDSFRFGKGVEKDTEKARQLLKKGCDMGHLGCDWLKEMR